MQENLLTTSNRRITPDVSVGTTSEWRLSDYLALQGTGLLGVGYASVSDIHKISDERANHYGVAPQALLALRPIVGDRASLDVTAGEYFVSDVSGSGARQDNVIRTEASLTCAFIASMRYRSDIGCRGVTMMSVIWVIEPRIEGRWESFIRFSAAIASARAIGSFLETRSCDVATLRNSEPPRRSRCHEAPLHRAFACVTRSLPQMGRGQIGHQKNFPTSRHHQPAASFSIST
jgi:hypothetical protein